MPVKHPIVKPILILACAATFLAACAEKRPDRRGPPPEQEMDPAKREQRVASFVARWDFDGDGAATCADVALSRSRLFRLLDEDKDGKLSSGEYRHAKFEDKGFLFYDFLRVDMNGSGEIDVDELAAIPNSMFQSADKDGNCRISPPEAMMAMREARMGDAPGEGRAGKDGRGGRGSRPEGGHGPGGGGPMMTEG